MMGSAWTSNRFIQEMNESHLLSGVAVLFLLCVEYSSLHEEIEFVDSCSHRGKHRQIMAFQVVNLLMCLSKDIPCVHTPGRFVPAIPRL